MNVKITLNQEDAKILKKYLDELYPNFDDFELIKLIRDTIEIQLLDLDG